MAATAADLGKKFTCFKCECRFYDLNKPEPLCPRCGADQREDPNPDPREAFLARFRRPSRSRSKKKVAPKEAPAPAAEELKDAGDLLDDDFENEAGDGAAAKDDEKVAKAEEKAAAKAAKAEEKAAKAADKAAKAAAKAAKQEAAKQEAAKQEAAKEV